MFGISVIEVELLIYNIFGDAINLDLRLMDNYSWISNTTSIDFTLLQFRFE